MAAPPARKSFGKSESKTEAPSVKGSTENYGKRGSGDFVEVLVKSFATLFGWNWHEQEA